MRKYIIYYCPREELWRILVRKAGHSKLYTAIADCPDKVTAQTVLVALELKEDYNAKPSAEAGHQVAVPGADTYGQLAV